MRKERPTTFACAWCGLLDCPRPESGLIAIVDGRAHRYLKVTEEAAEPLEPIEPLDIESLFPGEVKDAA